MKKAVFLLAGLLLAAAPLRAQDDAAPLLFGEPLAPGPVYVVPVEGTIDNALARYIDRALGDAEKGGAALVVFHVNTFGGLVDAADHIRQRILRTPVPTVAFVDHNAISAGALISYAADKIVMAPGGTFGAATVVEGVGGAAAPDKYQSAMRALMRATAEENGRDPRVAEAMVDETLEVPGLSKKGEVLTLSSGEARNAGVADAVLPTLDAAIAAAGLESPAVVQHGASMAERVLRFFGSPVVQSILMLMMMGGLYFELQSPGVGFPGLMALLGALAFFAPSYMLGLVESWEIVLFFIGVILLGVEVFVLPGFGVAGILGIGLIVVSLGTALVANVGFAFPGGESLTQAILTMAATLVLLVLLMFSLARYAPRTQRMNRLVLHDAVGPDLDVVAATATLGQRGIALTTLRPAGTVELGGLRVDARSTGDFVLPGTPVEVVRLHAGYVDVQPVRTAALNA